MNDRRRPQAPSESPAKVTTASMTQGADLALMPRSEWSIYLTGRQDGLLEGEQVGYTRGYQACDDEIATLQREAAKVVLLMAGLDPHEVAQRRRRERQVEAAERHAQAAQPWPAEATS